MKLRHNIINCHVVRPVSAGGFEFLQLRRREDDYMGGSWGIVRGGIESGETAWQAALRELREETGLVPTEFYQLDVVDIFYLAVEDSIRMTPGFCAIVDPASPVVLDDEHDAFRWVPRHQIIDLTLWPGERQQLQELFREILDDGPAKVFMRIKI